MKSSNAVAIAVKIIVFHEYVLRQFCGEGLVKLPNIDLIRGSDAFVISKDNTYCEKDGEKSRSEYSLLIRPIPVRKVDNEPE